MKQKLIIVSTLFIMLAGILGVFLTVRHVPAHAAAAPIFSDNFDKYKVGALPTGTGAAQWTTVNTKGQGFAIAVSATQVKSKPNSLQVSLGSGFPGHAWTEKDYTPANKSLTQIATFNLYLDTTFSTAGQFVTLFITRAHPTDAKGSIVVVLTNTNQLEVVRYDSTGKRVQTTTKSTLAKGQWYAVQLNQTDNSKTGSWSLLLNGKQIAGQTAVNTGITPVNTIIVGDVYASIKAMTGSLYIDDVKTAA